MTILELKIKAVEKLGRDATTFQAERASLEEYLANWNVYLRTGRDSEANWDEIKQKKNGLMAVNALLWEAEDLVRTTPELEAIKLSQLCKRIARLNDARAMLVVELSNLYGEKAVSEKVYAAGR
jgi:glutaredoxin-related protein